MHIHSPVYTSSEVMGPALEANINMSDTLHFPKLNGSNYNSWATSMKSAFQSHFV